MLRRLSSLAAFALLATGGCDEKEPPTPTYTPGVMKAVELPKLGLKIQAPDNVTVTDGPTEAKLEAEGFPTTTISRKDGEFNGTGTSSGVGGGEVEFRYTIPSTEWYCVARNTGKHEALIVKICESMEAPKNPTVKMKDCKTVRGFASGPVNTAWQGKADAFKACFADTELTSASFGFNFRLQDDGARNFSKHASPTVPDASAECIAKIYEELEKEVLGKAEGSAEVACDGGYSQH